MAAAFFVVDVELLPLAIARALGGMRLAGMLTSAWLSFLGEGDDDEEVLSKEFNDAVASTFNTPFYLNSLSIPLSSSNAYPRLPRSFAWDWYLL